MNETRHPRRRAIRARWAVVCALVAAFAGSAALLLWPVQPAAFASHSAPVLDFDSAQMAVGRIQAAEAPGINPVCRTQLLSHGRRTEAVIVFVHGYTSCPEQFAELAKLYFADGANVLMLRLPLHGSPDRMTESHARLRAADLVAYADSAVDLARGLGERVSVAGISAGGLIAGWIAQNRSDVERAVLIAPVFGYTVVPPSLTLPAMNLFRLLPDAFEWWDPELREAVPPVYGYPRYSRHALAQLLRLSLVVEAQAKRSAPLARSVVFVTNAGDSLVSRAMIGRVAGLWQRSAPDRVSSYEFPLSVGVGHDLIDPSQPNQRTDVVYAKLRELLPP